VAQAQSHPEQADVDDFWLIPDSTVAGDGQPPGEMSAAAASDEAIEVDLSELLGGFTRASPPPADLAPTFVEPVEARDLDAVFEQFREQTSRGPQHETARSHFDRGVALRDEGRIEESMQAFKTASREPRLRFHAAAAVARLHGQRGDLLLAVDWLEQAIQAPAPSADEANALFYELAEALESLGEVERALAICLELQAEAGDYRDVADRIRRLAKVQTRG
jgi:tetratricopeptide (TPR) repeat protein